MFRFQPFSCRRFSLNYANEPNEGMRACVCLHFPNFIHAIGQRFPILLCPRNANSNSLCAVPLVFQSPHFTFSELRRIKFQPKFKFDGIVLQISTHTHECKPTIICVCDAAYGVWLAYCIQTELKCDLCGFGCTLCM